MKLLSTIAWVRLRWGEFKEGAKNKTMRCEHESMKIEQDGFNLLNKYNNRQLCRLFCDISYQEYAVAILKIKSWMSDLHQQP